MSEQILLVDDDRNILDGYRRSLHSEFSMETAQSGQEALALLAGKTTYSVIISDMRMPAMDGIELLKRVKKASPDTVRMMLTGNADVQTAIEAINEGSIFRFLIKPCAKETMAKAITSALMQYRLIVAEKQLLEQTLSGCLQVLSEVLSLVNPAAFSRAERARRYIHHVVTAMQLGNPWQYEVAAMLSQLGCVTLAPETIDAVYGGQTLSPSEQAQYDEHPRVASALISKIPRLEPIAWMIGHQNHPITKSDEGEDSEMRTGAEILRLVLEYEQLTHQGVSRTESAHRLAMKNRQFSPKFFETLVMLDPNAEDSEIRKTRIADLTPGMILQQEVRTRSGLLLVSRGQQVTPMLIFKLKNSHGRGDIPGDVMVSLPKSTLSFVKSASSD
ncbi:MAG TPA: response regulator [Candidatus Binatia bacterium]|nr:response regulator [Candidatus Binatia bacterium]